VLGANKKPFLLIAEIIILGVLSVIDQKFIGVAVSTETEIRFFEEKKLVAKQLRKN
jgi:hypothetical protein